MGPDSYTAATRKTGQPLLAMLSHCLLVQPVPEMAFSLEGPVMMGGEADTAALFWHREKAVPLVPISWWGKITRYSLKHTEKATFFQKTDRL